MKKQILIVLMALGAGAPALGAQTLARAVYGFTKDKAGAGTAYARENAAAGLAMALARVEESGRKSFWEQIPDGAKLSAVTVTGAAGVAVCYLACKSIIGACSYTYKNWDHIKSVTKSTGSAAQSLAIFCITKPYEGLYWVGNKTKYVAEQVRDGAVWTGGHVASGVKAGARLTVDASKLGVRGTQALVRGGIKVSKFAAKALYGAGYGTLVALNALGGGVDAAGSYAAQCASSVVNKLRSLRS